MAKQQTDARLLDIAIDHFGRRGLEGASTRAIAADAGTPMSSITYHFGGKEGLYLAAADHIAATVSEWLAPALAEVRALCGDGPDAATARRALHIITARMIEMMVSPQNAAFSRFIIREQAEPTEAFSRIYAGIMRGMLIQVSGLLRIVSHGRLDEHEAKLRAMTIVGQILVFRVARATVLAGTGWSDVGADETVQIKRIVADNLDAIFDRLEAGGSA